MPSNVKLNLLSELEKRFGRLQKLAGSLSMFDIGNGNCRVYIRYSKLHDRKQAFYGLRKDDLRQLEGIASFICFLWDTQTEPLFVPYYQFEEVFSVLEPASDGQFKVQVYQSQDCTELYIANAGRFNVESFFGWYDIENLIEKGRLISIPSLTHFQMQTLLGAIGVRKGYDVWIPLLDKNRLDWEITQKFECRSNLPERYTNVQNIIGGIDVMWLKKGSTELSAVFEVEHSTPIYSGLLRFNDLHLVEPNLKPKCSIVANDSRRTLFLKQVNRPTFKISGLSEICNFLDYKDVYMWFKRIFNKDV